MHIKPFTRIVSILTVLSLATVANAGAIFGGSLLDNASANQLETWLGVEDQDFTNVWSGQARVNTATQFHQAVDNVGPTISIYEISFADGLRSRVGGYTSLSWSGSGYKFDATAFLFNLDSNEIQRAQHYSYYSILAHYNYFPTFGGGHDLYGGYRTLGGCYSYNANCSGYSFSHTYDQSQGQITIAGDNGYANGNSGINYNAWRVESLEVYTFSQAVAVMEPNTFALFGLGLIGLGIARRK